MPQRATPLSPARDSRASRVLVLASAALLALVTLFVPSASLSSLTPQPDAPSAAAQWCEQPQGRPGPHAALLNTPAARGTPPDAAPFPHPGLITATATDSASHRSLGGPDQALSQAPSDAQSSDGPGAPRAPPCAPRSELTFVSA
ncbi:hypothetical protein ACFQ0X_39780 [Streptomyces rectiviolaceus]|uniref:Secreted protein n=1 Tax=Streptomyces rectiviolaceus TaxID=332591 RepID=A0ABP6MZX2_9ACTN